MIRANRKIYGTRLNYKENFPLWLLAGMTMLLIVGLSSLEFGEFGFSLIIAVLLIIAMFSYYATFFREYRRINDALSVKQENYYLQCFSVFWVIAFAGFFLIVFAYLGATLDLKADQSRGSPTAVFNWWLLYMVLSFLDTLTLGTLDNYNFLSAAESRLFNSGNIDSLKNASSAVGWKRHYVHFTRITTELALVVSLYLVITETFYVRRELRKALTSNDLDKSFWQELTPLKAREIYRMPDKGKLIEKRGRELATLFRHSKSSEARHVMLRVFQTTKSRAVFGWCITYFQKNRDQRFRNLIWRLNANWQKRILKERGLINYSKNRRS